MVVRLHCPEDSQGRILARHQHTLCYSPFFQEGQAQAVTSGENKTGTMALYLGGQDASTKAGGGKIKTTKALYRANSISPNILSAPKIDLYI